MVTAIKSQVGINTKEPRAMLDIMSVGSTSDTKFNSSAKEIFTLLDNGMLGLEVEKPVVKLVVVLSATIVEAKLLIRGLVVRVV